MRYFDHFTASLMSSTKYWKKILGQSGLLIAHEAKSDFWVRLLKPQLHVFKAVHLTEFMKLLEAAVD